MATCADGRIIAVFNQGTLDCIYHGYFNGANDIFSGNMTPRAETWRETGYTANGRVFNINGGLNKAKSRPHAFIVVYLFTYGTII